MVIAAVVDEVMNFPASARTNEYGAPVWELIVTGEIEPDGPVAPVDPVAPVGPVWPSTNFLSVDRQAPPFE